VTDRRPKTRADCIDGPRPCPWLGCRYHLGVEVEESRNARGIRFFVNEAGTRRSIGDRGVFVKLWYRGKTLPVSKMRIDRLVSAVMSRSQTCALDIAEQGGLTLAEVGSVLGVSRERVRQIESGGLRAIRSGARALKRMTED